MGLSCFHIYQLNLEVCKINETFQAKLHENHYLLRFMSFSHLQMHTRSGMRVLLKVVLCALHGRSRECSCQKDFTSQMSTYLWLGFTSPITPCLRTMLLKRKILSCQKEGRNLLLKQVLAHSSEPVNIPSKTDYSEGEFTITNKLLPDLE